MQHKLQTKKGELLLVEVPDDAINFAMGWEDNARLHYYHKNYKDSFDHRSIKLNGSYEIVCPLNSITEDIAKEYVEDYMFDGEAIGYKDYQHSGVSYTYAISSFQSLIRSQSIDTSKCYVILKAK